MTDFRALCAELLEAIEDDVIDTNDGPRFQAVVDRASAALAQPEPPSLKEQALGALYAIATGADDTREFHQDIETIKEALESQPD
jgi:hypothetical protein